MCCAVGMYLRETKRTNKDGSVVSYLQLAHNERHAVTGAPTAKVIHNFGRAELVDRDALARLVSSISRLLTPEQAVVAAATGQVEVLDSRRLGGAWTLDQVWGRLGIGAAIRRVAAGRRLDADAVGLAAELGVLALEPLPHAMRPQIGVAQNAADLAHADPLAGALGQAVNQRTVRPQVAKRRGRVLAVGPRARELHQLTPGRHGNPRRSPRARRVLQRRETRRGGEPRLPFLRTWRDEQLSCRAI